MDVSVRSRRRPGWPRLALALTAWLWVLPAPAQTATEDWTRLNQSIVEAYRAGDHDERADLADALRATQRDNIADGRPPDSWAPYVLIGG